MSRKFPSREANLPQSGNEGYRNAFVPLALQQDSDFVMDEVERGEESAPDAGGTNWQAGRWGEEGEISNTISGVREGSGGGARVQMETHQQQTARQLRPLHPQGRENTHATRNPQQQEPPPPTYREVDESNQPIQWAGTVFRNTMGNPTPNELRERARGQYVPRQIVTRSDDGPSRRPHRQPSPGHVDLVTRLRAAGIDVAHDTDSNIPRGARIIMEEMLFQIQQRATEVAHLRRKVDHLQEDSRVRKCASSDDEERPAKRRERRARSPEASTDSSRGRPLLMATTRQHTSRPYVETRGRSFAQVATRYPLVVLIQLPVWLSTMRSVWGGDPCLATH